VTTVDISLKLTRENRLIALNADHLKQGFTIRGVNMSEKKRTRDFAEFVTDLRGGICHQEVSEAIQEVTAACRETGKVGSVTLTIKIKPQGDRQVEILDQIKKVVPEHAKMPTFAFIDDHDNLTRSDPRQASLDDVRVVDKETGELKVVGGV
jgi:ACT domain-containing protein